MPTIFDLRSLHGSQDLPASPASDLKNAFKSVFQQALQSGPVSITRNRKREAVLLSADLYDQMVSELSARDPLEKFRKDYDARFEALQSEAARVAFDDAFSAPPEELGESAVREAAKP